MLELIYKTGVICHEQIIFQNPNFPVLYIPYKQKKSGFAFIPHQHRVLELLYVEKGAAHIICSNKSYICRAGEFMFFNPMEPHSCLYADGPYLSRCLQIDFTMLASRFSDICETQYIDPIFQNKLKFRNHIQHNKELHALFFKIIKEFKGQQPGYEITVKGNLYLLLSWLLRNAADRQEPKPQPSTTQQKTVNDIINHLTLNYQKEIHLNELASLFYMSKPYLCRIFKNYTGQTITEYLNNIRILKATNLLKNTDLPIGEIATEVGFNDINYFSRTFKKIIGTAPSRVRSNPLGKFRNDMKR